MTTLDRAPDVGAHTSTSPYALIPLELIDPNPWQPREQYDLAHISGLADDIASRYDSRPSSMGLLQVPAARVIGPGGEVVTLDQTTGPLMFLLAGYDRRIQLAYGHNRWKAFQALSERDPQRWGVLPVDLVSWSDEEMATAAWAENSARKDLNPLEEARAIQRYMLDFGWTQDQVADRLKINRTTVAHKVRLTRLPPEQQQQLREGELSARQAAALLPLLEAPAATLAAAEKRSAYNKPSQVIARAVKQSSDRIRQEVGWSLSEGSASVERVAWRDHRFESRGLESPTCPGCPLYDEAKKRCGNVLCHDKKQRLWDSLRLEAASLAAGIPGLKSAPPYGKHESFYGQGADALRASGCDKLRVWPGYGSGIPNHPGFAIGCAHMGAGCACLKAQREAQHQAAQEQHRQREEATERERGQVRALVGDAADVVAAALLELQATPWTHVLGRLNVTLEPNKEMSLERCMRALALGVASIPLSHQGRVDPETARVELVPWLESLGLGAPWPPPEPPEPPADLEDAIAQLETWLADTANEGGEPDPDQLESWLDRAEVWESLGIPEALRPRFDRCVEELTVLVEQSVGEI